LGDKDDKMKNFITLIAKYHFFILFVILEGIGFYFISTYNLYQNVKAYNVAQSISGSYYEKTNELNQYLSLRTNNEMLVNENAQLRAQLASAKLAIKSDTTQVRDSVYKQVFTFMAATIINSSTNKQYNYLTLDKGRLAGVKPEMGVISGNGIVGVVEHVTDHYSTVISLLNRNIKVSAKFKKNGFFGSFEWPGRDYRTGILNDIPLHVSVSKGDTIVTSSYSSIYPEGINIGYVKDFTIIGGNFYSISVTIATDFKKISQVNIVSHLLKQELDSIENLKRKE
jgi:rod shape-determining protein MreC